MNLKRKFLSTAMAVICGVNMCITGGITANAVETVPGYNNVDNYLADSVMNGYVSLSTGESDEAYGLYNPSNTKISVCDTLAELIIEQDVVSAENFSELDPELLGDVTVQQAYEIFLLNYLTYETENVSTSTHDYNAVLSKVAKYALSLLTDLVDAGAASSEEQAQKMLESTSSADNTKMLAALKKLGYDKDLSDYKVVSSELSSVSGNAYDYYVTLAYGLAVQELNQDKVDLLNAMKDASVNTDFRSAVDNVVDAIEGSYSDVSLDDEYGYIYALDNAWAVIKKNISGMSSAETAADAMNSLFDSSDETAAKMAVLMQYNVNNYMDAAVENEYYDYDSSSSQNNAEDLHTAYRNSLIYQQYASEMAIKYAPMISEEDVTSKLEREISSAGTQITIIDIWYDNYLEYTDTETVEIDFSADVVEYNGHYYKVFNNSISWIYAKEYCELMGGHLATITDEEEQYVVEMLSTQSPEFDNFWIGGYLDKKTKKWMWVDDTEFSYKNWDDNQPDFHQGEEYYIRFTNKDVNYENWTAHMGKWNDCANEASGDDNTGDAVGIQTFAFICEWDSEINYLTGDANGDGKVNVRDAAFIASAMANGEGDKLPISADFNEDGKVNVRDAAAIAAALAKGLL